MPTQEATGAIERHALQLRELLQRAVDSPGFSAGLAGRDIEVRQVTDDSRVVVPGACFVALKGTRQDGSRFVAEAVSKGAVAIVSEENMAAPAAGVPTVRVPDARRALARMAAIHRGLADLNWRPPRSRGASPPLCAVAVTGTNGKSTTCALTQAILKAAGHRCALLGTIRYDLISRQIEAPMTTPPATQLIDFLVEAARAGATHAVMEASSHALDQRRTDGIRFDVGVFTNLTGDHLDYHGTREAYRLAKRRLFDGLDSDATAAVNLDDPVGESMLEACRARPIRFGFGSHADLYARIESIDARGSRFEIVHEGRRVPIRLKLVGRHNIQNAMGATAAALALGIGWETIVAGLESVECVRGRLEPVRRPDGGPMPFAVLVDYAHTDDALENVLSALRPLSPRRLIVLFGCGGDRDRSKRPRMARVAAQWADCIIVTSDNPRSESPADIIDEILCGFSPAERERVAVQPDRRSAIREAIDSADEGDVVVLAGKGHETYQEACGRRIHFDDAEVAAECLAERFGRSGAKEA